MQDLIKKLQADCSAVFESDEFNDDFYYEENDLGFTYDKEGTTFKVWSPVASSVSVNLYETGEGDSLIRQIPMNKGEKGVWSVYVQGDLDGVYYTYYITIDNVRVMDRDNPDNVAYAYCEGGVSVLNETTDVYSKAVGVNGNRSMVVNLKNTNPDGWENDVKPEFKEMTDAVIYEMHVRDVSMDEVSGITNKGKFIGLAETGTVNSNGSSTGIDHIRELGITHVHLLPSFDYQTIDESRLEDNEFNWGYDPKNYNVPEGSYSTNPYDGKVRIKEFKKMVKAFHDNGIRVVMDVVYNHTYAVYDSNFTKTVPNYYYRTRDNINTNGSGCGNETASEHKMYRKYMIDSLLYWAREYHVDGFRFDLMAVHDIDTMNEITKALKGYDSSLIIYGEGWTGGPSKLEWSRAAFKENAKLIPQAAMFSDDIRDAIKGSVMDGSDKGFINGGLSQKSGDALEAMINLVRFGICGATRHPQVRTRDEVNWDKAPVFWANNPTQCISYVSVHDNWTLFDKISITCPEASFGEKVRMNKLAAGILLTSQGISLFQAGEEMLRSKPVNGGFEENSYKSPDSVNCIKWDDKDKYRDVVEYYKGLIKLRRTHEAFRMSKADDVADLIRFEEGTQAGLIIYDINAAAAGDSLDAIRVIINGTDSDVCVNLPEGTWNVYVNDETAGNSIIENVSGKAVVKAISIMVIGK